MKNTFLLSFLSILLIFSCKKEEPIDDTQKPSGKVKFSFEHLVDGQTLIIDSLMYFNEAGNQYEVNEIQYFISDVILHKKEGGGYSIQEWKDIHYVDTDIPGSLIWDVFDKIPVGDYTGISFTFGINETKNQSFMFVNPPESFMFWPEVLGGGYHYLKLNGKWKDPQNSIRFFNFHLGIGQLATGQGTEFIHNHFTISLNDYPFSIEENKTTIIPLIMHIENWFKDPHIYDHNFFGGDIMENQAAMQIGAENGHDVFSVGIIQ